jgi:hypothetical protein
VIGGIEHSRHQAVGVDLPVLLRTAAVATLFGAQAIHVRAMLQHWPLWRAAGLFFFVVAVAEGGIGAWLALEPSARAARIAVALSFVTMIVWAVSRTVGLPIGPHPWIAEPTTAPDAIATGLEMLTAVTAVAWLRRPSESRPLSTVGLICVGAIVAGVAALTWIGMTAPGHLSAPGH